MEKTIIILNIILLISGFFIGSVAAQPPENILPNNNSRCDGPIPNFVQGIVPDFLQSLMEVLPVPNFVKILFGVQC